MRAGAITVAALCVAAGLVAAPGDARTTPAGFVAAATSRTVVAYALPVPGPVTRLFERPLHRWSAGHRGVDLAATPGTTVRSPAAGVVTFAGPVAGRGVITVRHADGLRSSLEPVSTTLTAGDQVTAGAPLGTLQDVASHDGVHWGVRDGTTYLDPLGLLTRTRLIVLLPVDA